MKDNGEFFLDRVLTVIDEFFDTESEFTRICGLPHNFVTRAKNRGYLNPTYETLLLIKEGIESKTERTLSWRWLLEGDFKGDKFRPIENGDTEGLDRQSIDILGMSADEVIRIHPELNRKMDLLHSQLEMQLDFLTGIMPESD